VRSKLFFMEFIVVDKPDHGINEWYDRYKREKGSDRNDMLRNPGILFQHLSLEASIIRALRVMNIVPKSL
jgi:hypothetical protein